MGQTGLFAALLVALIGVGCDSPGIECPALPTPTVPAGPPDRCDVDCTTFPPECCDHMTVALEPGESVFGGFTFEDLTGCYEGYDPTGRLVARLHLGLEQMYFTACGCLTYFQGWYAASVEILPGVDDRLPPDGQVVRDLMTLQGESSVETLEWPDNPAFGLLVSPCNDGIGCGYYGHTLPSFPVDLGGWIVVDGMEIDVGFVRR